MPTSRQTSVNTKSLEDYSHLIQDTINDLEARLEVIDGELECIFETNVTQSRSDAEFLSMKEERFSTEKCLQICSQLSDHIDQIQFIQDQGAAYYLPDSSNSACENVTNEGLQKCKYSLAAPAAKAENHMQDAVYRLLSQSKSTTCSEKDEQVLGRVQDEWNAARQYLDICSKADNHMKENVRVLDNHGSGDSLQSMVSIKDVILHEKMQAQGWRTRQVGGHISDASIQQLSNDFATIDMGHLGSGEHPSTDHSTLDQRDQVKGKITTEFEQRYGQGFKLNPTKFPEASTSRKSRRGEGVLEKS